VERLRRGHLYIGPGGGGEEGRRSPAVMEFQCFDRFGEGEGQGSWEVGRAWRRLA
jgi:hypothetical protein